VVQIINSLLSGVKIATKSLPMYLTFCNINTELLAKEFAYFLSHFLNSMPSLISDSSNTIQQNMTLIAVMQATRLILQHRTKQHINFARQF
jgi:hypothetical protein